MESEGLASHLRAVAEAEGVGHVIGVYPNWNNSTDKDYLDASRALTQAAHEALGGAPGTRALVVDPFAGGGFIPPRSVPTVSAAGRLDPARRGE